MGATTVVDASSTCAADAVRELTNGGADFVFETSGVPAVAESCADMVGNGGTIVLVGIPSKEATVAIRPADLIPREIAILTSHVGSLRPTVDLPRYITLAKQGHLQLEPLVSRRFALEQINDALRRCHRAARPVRSWCSIRERGRAPDPPAARSVVDPSAVDIQHLPGDEAALVGR